MSDEPLLYPLSLLIPARYPDMGDGQLLDVVVREIDQQMAEVTRAVYEWAWGAP